MSSKRKTLILFWEKSIFNPKLSQSSDFSPWTTKPNILHLQLPKLLEKQHWPQPKVVLLQYNFRISRILNFSKLNNRENIVNIV
jgi:hypothetical protein